MCKNLIFNISMSMIIGSDLREIGLRFINDRHHDNSERHSLHNSCNGFRTRLWWRWCECVSSFISNSLEIFIASAEHFLSMTFYLLTNPFFSVGCWMQALPWTILQSPLCPKNHDNKSNRTIVSLVIQVALCKFIQYIKSFKWNLIFKKSAHLCKAQVSFLKTKDLSKQTLGSREGRF